MILRKLLSALFALSLALSFAVSPAYAFADKDCDDFATWEEAQRFFEENGGPARDPHRLDRDGDGIACEELQGFDPNHKPGDFVKDKDSENDNTQGSNNQNNGSSSQGGKLPKTATSYPTSALIGSGILAVGIGILLYRRRLTS